MAAIHYSTKSQPTTNVCGSHARMDRATGVVVPLATSNDWTQVTCKRCLKIQGYYTKPEVKAVIIDSVKVAETRKVDLIEFASLCNDCGYLSNSHGHANSH